MKQIFDFLKTTVLGGLIFLLPFAATILVAVRVGKMGLERITPLAEYLPVPKAQAVIAIYFGGAILLVVVGFAAGLIARSTHVETQAASFLEENVLKKLPPYAALRKYTDRLTGLEATTNGDLQPILVRVWNGWQLAFLADSLSDGKVVVCIPGGTGPMSGPVGIVGADQISPLNISYQDMLACLEKSGKGLPILLATSAFETQAAPG